MDLLTPQLRLLLHRGTAYWEVKWSISATPKLQNGLMGKAKETKLGGFSLDLGGGEIALAGAPSPSQHSGCQVCLPSAHLAM